MISILVLLRMTRSTCDPRPTRPQLSHRGGQVSVRAEAPHRRCGADLRQGADYAPCEDGSFERLNPARYDDRRRGSIDPPRQISARLSAQMANPRTPTSSMPRGPSFKEYQLICIARWHSRFGTFRLFGFFRFQCFFLVRGYQRGLWL